MIPVSCPNCRSPMGTLIETESGVYLNSGGWLISTGKRHCHVCGHLFHFATPKKTMAELRQSYIARVAQDPVQIAETLNRKRPSELFEDLDIDL